MPGWLWYAFWIPLESRYEMTNVPVPAAYPPQVREDDREMVMLPDGIFP